MCNILGFYPHSLQTCLSGTTGAPAVFQRHDTLQPQHVRSHPAHATPAQPRTITSTLSIGLAELSGNLAEKLPIHPVELRLRSERDQRWPFLFSFLFFFSAKNSLETEACGFVGLTGVTLAWLEGHVCLCVEIMDSAHPAPWVFWLADFFNTYFEWKDKTRNEKKNSTGSCKILMLGVSGAFRICSCYSSGPPPKFNPSHTSSTLLAVVPQFLAAIRCTN